MRIQGLCRIFFLMLTMIVPVLLAQDDPAKSAAGDPDKPKPNAKAKAKANAKALGPQAKAFQRIVVELDSNGDETLQRSEVPDSAREQFDALLELMDTDGDKALSRGELQAAGSRIQAVLNAGGPPAAAPKAAAKKGVGKEAPANPADRLRLMDTDGDGKISREEWRGAPALFDRIDRNGDGFVADAEREFAVQAMRRFMEAAKKKGQESPAKPNE